MATDRDSAGVPPFYVEHSKVQGSPDTLYTASFLAECADLFPSLDQAYAGIDAVLARHGLDSPVLRLGMRPHPRRLLGPMRDRFCKAPPGDATALADQIASRLIAHGAVVRELPGRSPLCPVLHCSGPVSRTVPALPGVPLSWPDPRGGHRRVDGFGFGVHVCERDRFVPGQRWDVTLWHQTVGVAVQEFNVVAPPDAVVSDVAELAWALLSGHAVLPASATRHPPGAAQPPGYPPADWVTSISTAVAALSSAVSAAAAWRAVQHKNDPPPSSSHAPPPAEANNPAKKSAKRRAANNRSKR